ncbi:MAG: RNA polymerase sigma factor [Rhodospirillaceae bacterium]
MFGRGLTMAPDARETDLKGLSERYRAPLKRHFMRHGLTPEDAEDCVQDVFVRIYRADLTIIENVEAYIFTVASSVAIDQGRKARSRQAGKHDPINNLVLESKEASPARVLEDREALARLDRILDELRPRTREIFLLNRLDGLSYTQLAARFGVSVAAIEKQISKALAHIRKRFARHD